MVIRPVDGTMTLLTSVDPIKVTEYSVVFSAVALPLTYIPILIIANDPDYLGEHTNGRLMNIVASALSSSSSLHRRLPFFADRSRSLGPTAARSARPLGGRRTPASAPEHAPGPNRVPVGRIVDITSAVIIDSPDHLDLKVSNAGPTAMSSTRYPGRVMRLRRSSPSRCATATTKGRRGRRCPPDPRRAGLSTVRRRSTRLRIRRRRTTPRPVVRLRTRCRPMAGETPRPCPDWPHGRRPVGAGGLHQSRWCRAARAWLRADGPARPTQGQPPYCSALSVGCPLAAMPQADNHDS